jgi:pimeloyl-ACP methyl ester carboxylesterase
MTFARRCAFAALGFLLLAAAPNADAPYLHPQQLVDVGGRRINLYCTGSGSPVVVLDTDGDDTTAMWRFVQPAVAAKARVCSYDPPGFGFSDPLRAGDNADADANATALHEALKKAGITGRIVLVANSVSGLYDRVYADRYRSEVAGMVFASPNIPYQNEALAKAAPAIGASMKMDAFLRSCLEAAKKREIVPGKPAYKQCMYSPPDPTISATLLAFIHRQWQSVGLWTSFAAGAGDEVADRSSMQVEREQRAYGAMPMIVLTTTQDIRQLPLPADQKASLLKFWIDSHKKIAALSSIGVDRIVADSSSSIQMDRPKAIISAIESVLAQVRR